MKKSMSFRGFSAYRLWSQLPSLEVSHLPDVIMFAAGIALFYGVVTVGRSWFGPFRPSVEISRSLWMLPARDVIAMGLWIAGFAGNTIVWRNERFNLNMGRWIKCLHGTRSSLTHPAHQLIGYR